MNTTQQAQSRDQHSHSCLPNSTTASRDGGDGVETGADYSTGLFIMMLSLSCVLFIMVILLVLPKSVQDAIFRWISCQSPEASFNYIDVGLYKTRHSMYRKEIYSLAMQRNRLRGTDKLPNPSIKDDSEKVGQRAITAKEESTSQTTCPTINLGTYSQGGNKQKVKLTITITPDNLPEVNQFNSTTLRPMLCLDKSSANRFNARSSDLTTGGPCITSGGPIMCSSLPDLSHSHSEAEVTAANSATCLEAQHSLPDTDDNRW